MRHGDTTFIGHGLKTFKLCLWQWHDELVSRSLCHYLRHARLLPNQQEAHPGYGMAGGGPESRIPHGRAEHGGG